MSDKSSNKTKKPGEAGKVRSNEREKRLRTALRKNLGRRKEQARARKGKTE